MDPWGNPRGQAVNTWPTDKGFLSKPLDATGLTAVGARYYDAAYGRFISVDSVMNLTDPDQWNAYAYAGNNPITRWDPTGLLSGLRIGDGNDASVSLTTFKKTHSVPNSPASLYTAFTTLQKQHRSKDYVDLYEATGRPAGERAMGFNQWNLVGTTAQGYRDEISNCAKFQCMDPCPDQGCQAARTGVLFGGFALGLAIDVGIGAALGWAARADAAGVAAETGAGEATLLQRMRGYALDDTGAVGTWSTSGGIKSAGLPNSGSIRYVPPTNYRPGVPLPRGGSNGYIDRFGNEWVKGPSRTSGQPFEWDVQLSERGRSSIGWLSRDGSHVNVSLDGRVTH
ncbi:MAG: hypothetical protein KQH57_20625 [Actinomycetales bacterium]|nr:hypothetical protein [Actinomycetales bacterium]